MFKGISVCLLDTFFSLLFIESENTSYILIHSVQFCLNIDIPDYIDIYCIKFKGFCLDVRGDSSVEYRWRVLIWIVKD